ncbi:hypothetical protein L7F22_003829 [Adiantum nelumboides]|nr:hypothetical protein [Adiantum nelumboides]
MPRSKATSRRATGESFECSSKKTPIPGTQRCTARAAKDQTTHAAGHYMSPFLASSARDLRAVENRNAMGQQCTSLPARDSGRLRSGIFNNGYILAAHAHRVTIMARNFDTLQRLRFRFDQLLQPVPIRDVRTMNILNIPPLHPCARQTEPARANLNSKSTRSRVKKNSIDGQADEGHE